MALNPVFAFESAANSNHTTFSDAIGDIKAYFLRIAVDILNNTGNQVFYNASQHPFLSYSSILIGCDLPARVKEENSSSFIVSGTAKLQNLHFEQEDGIVHIHSLLYTDGNFSDKLQTFTAIRHLYYDSHRNFTSNVYPGHDTPQLYSDKVQIFIARAQIFRAKLLNDGATLKNAGNRSYRLCSKRQPFAFCNKTVCTLAYPFSCSF